MKLTIVVGVLNQFELADETIKRMVDNLSRKDEVEMVVIDNGSDTPFIPKESRVRLKVVRNEVNTGNYPMFKQALEHASGEYVAFLHSDVFVHQEGWDDNVIAQFEAHGDLGLIGFIGSTEIDNWGGRGMGTVSNMQGFTIKGETGKVWTASAGHHHGKVSGGMTIDGSVVDGCVMIFRKNVLRDIEVKKDLPPHHFYDRIMSCQVIELGYKVGILGIEFDHVSGQVANHESKWQDTSREWFRTHMGIESPSEWAKIRPSWVSATNNPSAGKVPDQWDYCSYLEAEYQFLSEYRDQKHLIPLVYGKSIR